MFVWKDENERKTGRGLPIQIKKLARIKIFRQFEWWVELQNEFPFPTFKTAKITFEVFFLKLKF